MGRGAGCCACLRLFAVARFTVGNARNRCATTHTHQRSAGTSTVRWHCSASPSELPAAPGGRTSPLAHETALQKTWGRRHGARVVLHFEKKKAPWNRIGSLTWHCTLTAANNATRACFGQTFGHGQRGPRGGRSKMWIAHPPSPCCGMWVRLLGRDDGW